MPLQAQLQQNQILTDATSSFCVPLLCLGVEPLSKPCEWSLRLHDAGQKSFSSALLPRSF